MNAEVEAMVQEKFDLLLHPVRMQIIQAYSRGRRMTVQELGERLPDVPPATLYRHLNALADADMLQVAEERKVRGAVERVYTLRQESVMLSPAEVSRASRADHMRYFTTFIANVLGSFGRYLKRPHIDIENDGAAYRQVRLNLTKDELASLVDDLSARMNEDLRNEPTPERQAYTITRIVIPEDFPKDEE
jgi:DNA-binding transcriptional ArsR family regulator